MTDRSKIARWLSVAILFSLMVFQSADALGKTYYVRTRGDDKAAGTHPKQAWKTLRKAAQVARKGDRVFIGAGTYTDGSVWWNAGVRVIGDTAGKATGDRGIVRLHGPSNQWCMGFFRGGNGSIENLTVTSRYGVYVYNTALTTRGCTFADNYYGIYAYRAANQIESSTFKSRIYGVLSYYGNTSVSSCNFSEGNYGLYSVYENSLSIDKSQFTKNRGWPLMLLGNKWRVDNTIVNDNNYGVYMAGVTNRDLKFRKSQIENNRYYGVYFYNSNITLDKAAMAKLPTKNNGYGYAFNRSKARVSGVDISGHRYYGLLSWNGDLAVSNSRITKNGNGIYLNGNKTCSIQDSLVQGNSSWGMLVYRQPLQLSRSYVRENGYGMLLYQLTGKQIDLKEAQIAKNRYYGMYLYFCDLKLQPQKAGWGLQDNGYGIYAYRSTVDIDRYNMSGHRGTAFVSSQSTVSLRRCNFDNNGSAVSFNANKGTIVRNCTIRNNKSWGLVNGSGPIQVVNTPITGNGYGAYFYNNNDSQVQMSGSPIKDSKYIGLYTNRCTFEFTPATSKKWVLANNPYGIYSWYSNLKIKSRKFTGCRNYGILAYYGTLDVRDSEFSNNGTGLYAYRNGATIENVYSHHNRGWGLAVYEPAQVKNVKVDANNYGLYVYRPKENLKSLQNAHVTNNKYYGLYVYEGTVRFTNDSSGNVRLANNGYGIVGYKSDLTLDGVNLTGSRYYGVLSYYGKLLVKDSKLFKNGNSLYSYYTDTRIANSEIYENQGWGMLAYGNTVGFDRATIRDNNYGLYLYRLNNKTAQFKRSSIANNRYYGLYARECRLTFDGAQKGDCQLVKNGYGVAGYKSKLAFNNWTLEDSRYYGLVSWYSDIHMKDSIVRKNGNGVHAFRNSRTLLENCDVHSNTAWAVQSHFEPLQLSGTKIRDNRYGLYLNGMTDGEMQFSNSQISNTTYYGVYANACNVNFTKKTADKFQTKNNGYGFCVVNSTAHFDHWPVKGSKYYGLLSYYSDLTMNACDVSDNGNGLYLYKNKSVGLKNTKIRENRSWGVMSYYAGWAFDNVEIASNRYGLYAHTVTDDGVKMRNTTIRDNTYHGVYGYRSKLKFVKDDRWVLKNNGYGIVAHTSDFLVDGFDVTGSKYYGLLSYYGKLRVVNANITDNGNGMYLYRNTDVAVEDTNITKNRNWGVLAYWGGWKFKNVRNEENGNGMYVYRVTDADLLMDDVSISKNRGHGVYAVYSQLRFDEKVAKRMTVAGNGYGYTSMRSQLSFKNYDITNNRSYGVFSRYSTLDFDNATVSGNGRGVYSWQDSAVTVANSQLSGNKDWGLLSYYSPVNISSSKLSSNRHGAYLYRIPDGKVVLKGVEIAANQYHGLYLNQTNMTMDGGTSNRFQVLNNGYQITANSARLSMSDYAVTGGKYYGLIAYDSTLDVRNCSFTKNRNAIYMRSPKSSYFENVSVKENTGWGIMSYYSTPTYKNVEVDGNRYGMYMYRVNGSVPANGLAVINNQSHGIYFNSCSLAIAAKDTSVKIANNHHSIYSVRSNLNLDGFELPAGRGYGVLAYYGTLNLSNSSIAKHQHGAYIYRPDSATINNVNISNNSGWGMMTYGPNWKAGNVTIANNRYGLYLREMTDDQIDLTNVSITDNTYHGVYGYKCQLYFNSKNFNQPGSQWQLKNNGYGVTGYASDVKIDGVTMENSKYIGVLSYYGDLLVQGSTVRNNGHGLYLVRNNKVTVDRTRLYNNTGWAVLKYGGDLSMRNSVVTRNNVGLYLYGYANTDASNIWNTTIADNAAHGIYQANRGTGSLVNNIIASNRGSGYGFYTAAKINHSHNLVYGFRRNFVNTSPSDNDVVADPKFFDRANGNYTLNGFSPAVNRGQKMAGKVDTDIIGYARPAYGRWELGAYEYTKKTDQVRVTSWKEER